MSPSAQARVDRLVNRVKDHLTEGQTAAFREIVEHELRCQDRDTRHACADAIDAIDRCGDVTVGSALNRAASLAMNSHAV